MAWVGRATELRNPPAKGRRGQKTLEERLEFKFFF